MGGMRTGALVPAGLAAVLVGCAGLMNPEFGEQGMRHQRFVELDSALGMHMGRRLVVRVQEDLGQNRPAQTRPNVVTFRGRLLALDEGWVHLGRAADDTVRLGKGSVVGVWLVRSSGHSRLPGAAIGAVVAGAAAFGILQMQAREDRPSDNAQVLLIGGSGLVGGLLGAAVWSSERRGDQLYPVPPPEGPAEQ